MKKICIVTTISSTLSAFVLESALYLSQNGYSVTLMCARDDEFAKKVPAPLRYISVNMDRGIHLSGIKTVFEMAKIFRQERFDMLQYSTPNAAFYCTLAAKMAKIPVRLYCQWGIRYVGFEGIKRKIFKVMEKFVCKNATDICPDGPENIKFSVSEGLYKKEKAAVVWNGSSCGVNFDKYDILKKSLYRAEIREKYLISEDDIVIGFLGRISKDKGINELLEAFYKISKEKSNVKLLLAGGVEDEFTSPAFEMAKNDKRIIFCGHISEPVKYYSAMDIFTMPSYREGFCTAIIEAQSMGNPAVVTDIPGAREAVDKDKTGLLVKSRDVKSLYEALLTLCCDEEKRTKMSESAVEFVRSCFDSKILCEKILEHRNIIIKRNL